jgi:hypothetical protein
MDEGTTRDEATPEGTSGAASQAALGSGGATAAEPAEATGPDPDAGGWAAQLQRMIDDIGRQAAPVIREVAAKAAELAAVAGEKAGPFAQKAAEKTAEFGAVVAARGHEMATDLRRADGDGNGTPSAGSAPAGDADAPAPASGATEGETKGA